MIMASCRQNGYNNQAFCSQYEYDIEYDASVTMFTRPKIVQSHDNYSYEDDQLVSDDREWARRKSPIGAPTVVRLVESRRATTELENPPLPPRSAKRVLTHRYEVISPETQRRNDAIVSPRMRRHVDAKPKTLQRRYSVIVPPTFRSMEDAAEHYDGRSLSSTYRRNPEVISPPPVRRVPVHYDEDVHPVTPKKHPPTLIDFSSPKKTYITSTPRKEPKNISPFTTPTKKADNLANRTTAVIYPNSKVPSPRKADTSPAKSLKASWVTIPTTYHELPVRTLYSAAIILLLSGLATCATGFYLLSWDGRRYFLDFGLLSGFTAIVLGALGFRSGTWQWFPNRNYVSGYVLLSIFSLLTSAGLVVLITLRPKPGSALADLAGGAICGVSGLSLLLAGLGVITSHCCKYPPPDNRVEHCVEGFVL